MLLLPLISVADDLLENALITYLALTLNGQVSWLTRIAAVCTLTKTPFFLLSLLFVLNRGVVRIFRPLGVLDFLQ